MLGETSEIGQIGTCSVFSLKGQFYNNGRIGTCSIFLCINVILVLEG